MNGHSIGINKSNKVELTESANPNDRIKQLFDEQGVNGTFVLADKNGTIKAVHNQTRGKQRFSPASTFKILNTLIALDVGLVDSINSTFKWDGKKHWIDTWNQDQTLESAFRVSCVWCYQELAREIGLNAYENELSKIGFGNQLVNSALGVSASTEGGSKVDKFWLDGSLTISAFEQVGFLNALLNHELHYEQRHLDLLKSIMHEPSYDQGNLKLYGKTGWAAGDINVGWYIGFIESDEGTFVFALNMVLDDVDKASLRKELVFESLKALNVLPNGFD